MGNPITSTLPSDIDDFLQDVSQIHSGISYGDIMKFGEVYTQKDLMKLRHLEKSLLEEFEIHGEDTPKVKKIIKEAKKIVTNPSIHQIRCFSFLVFITSNKCHQIPIFQEKIPFVALLVLSLLSFVFYFRVADSFRYIHFFF